MPADVGTRLEQAKQESGPSAAGFTGLALNTFDQYHQQASDALPPEARSTFTLAAKPYRDFIGQGALQYEAKQRLDWRAGQYTQSADTWADQVARTPALLPLADAALRATQPRLNPEQNTMLGEYARDKLVQSGVAGALAQDAPGLLKALGGTTAMPGTNDPDIHPQPGDIDLDHPLVKLMTPSERDHYREVARITVLQQQASQREDLKSRTADATQSYLDTGTAKNPPMLSDMVNAFGEEEGSQRYRQMQDAAMLGQTKQRMLPLPQGELNRLRGQVPAEDDLQGQRNYKALTGAIDSIEQERRTDPLGFALKTKSYGLTPIKDFSDPAALAAELGKRQRANGTLRADYGTEPTVLSREENAQFTQTLKTLPGDKQAALLQQFAQGLNDPQMMDTATRGISANAPVQALAGLSLAKDYAGSEDEEMGHLPLGGSGKISAGQTMLVGEAARNPPADQPDAKPLPMPPDGQTRDLYSKLIGERFAGQPGAEEAHYQAALAAYAGLSKQAGDSSGKFDEQRWNAGVNLAVNGSGTAREIGLVGDEPEQASAATSGISITQDGNGASPQSGTKPDSQGKENTELVTDVVGKEGSRGAWGVAQKLAGPGANEARVNRIKNQLLFLNPNLADTVMEGQQYYVPNEDTPENSALDKAADAANTQKQLVPAALADKSATRRSDGEPTPFLARMEQTQRLPKGDLDFSENDPRPASAQKVWASGYGSEVHQREGAKYLNKSVLDISSTNPNALAQFGIDPKLNGSSTYAEKVQDLSDSLIKNVNWAHKWIDDADRQTAGENGTRDHSYLHVMSSPADAAVDRAHGWPQGTFVRQKATAFIQESLRLSWEQLDRGNVEDAERLFGLALHTAQDNTSPMHNGGQLWAPNGHRLHDIPMGIAHGVHETFAPGDNSNFSAATENLFQYWINRKLPDDTFLYQYGGDHNPKGKWGAYVDSAINIIGSKWEKVKEGLFPSNPSPPEPPEAYMKRFQGAWQDLGNRMAH
jgi:hypothetical protein